jgi:hypothetical protein
VLLVLWFLSPALKGEAWASPVVGQLDLVPGLNLVGIPVNPATVPDSYALLPLLGNSNEIERILWLNPTTGIYEETAYDSSGGIVGTNFPVKAGDAWLVYARVSKPLNYNVVISCPPISLTSGTNLISVPCAPANLTAYQLLKGLGGASAVSAIQSLDSNTGEFQTAGYMDGVPSGADFPILSGYGYFIFGHTRANRVICGQHVEAAISAAGESDLYRFTGTAGQIVSLTLGAGSWSCCGDANPVAEVFSPTGASVAVFGPSQREVTLLADGTYTIEVRAGDFTRTGNYGLSLQCLVPVGANAIPLECGSSVTGAITAVAKTVLYSFTGTAGQVVSLTLGAGSWSCCGDANPVAELFSPTGASVVVFGPSQREQTLTESGTYTIEVRAGDFTRTGNYGLSLQCLVPVGANAIPLECGSSVTGAITAVGKTVLYSFTGTAGQILSLTLGAGSWSCCGDPNPVAEVFSPTGVSVVLFGPGQQRPTLPESGTYTIELRAGDFTRTGDYGLSLQCLTLAEAEYHRPQWMYHS